MSATDITQEMRRRYAAALSSFGPASRGRPVAVLSIGPTETVVATGRSEDPDAVLVLRIGAETIARGHFGHTPPTALELENAILTVEDEIARALFPPDTVLLSMDAPLRELALLSGIRQADAMAMSRAAVEGTFERLAQAASGRPLASCGIPADPEFAARLLILREFMHHLQFDEIVCLRERHGQTATAGGHPFERGTKP